MLTLQRCSQCAHGGAVSGSRLLPMVKANGYGLGAVEVARALEALDPWGFGVATIEEGATLRAGGITRPIVVFTPLIADRSSSIWSLTSVPPWARPSALESWIARGERPFHLEIDTGMSRAGVRWNDQASSIAPRHAAPECRRLGRSFHPLPCRRVEPQCHSRPVGPLS